MALSLLNQLASKISQLSCFALLEGGEYSVLYGSSVGSHKESNGVYEMSEGRVVLQPKIQTGTQSAGDDAGTVWPSDGSLYNLGQYLLERTSRAVAVSWEVVCRLLSLQITFTG